jgi:hypothetical protein
MITCVVDYIIDPKKIDSFEKSAKRWIELVNRFGGDHHGYFLPAAGASDRALAIFSPESGRLRSVPWSFWRARGIYRGRSYSG